MLLRRFVRDALTSPTAGYFSRDVVGSLDAPLAFRSMLGEADYRAALAASYSSAHRAWLTPSEIFHPTYARALARSLAARHARLYPSEPLQLLELGGGRATAAHGILSWLRDEAPALFDRSSYTLVEASARLAEAQRARLLAFAPRVEVVHAGALEWCEGRGGREGAWHVLALELLDNLPHDKLRVRRGALEEARAEQDAGGAWRERFVPLRDETLAEASRVLRVDSFDGAEALEEAMVARPTLGGGRSVPLSARLRKLLRPILGRSREYVDVYVPTDAWRLLKGLAHAVPEHQLTIADFSWLPPQPGGAVASPVVQSQHGGVSRDHKGDIFAAAGGECDVFFPTHFDSLERMCRAVGHKQVQSVTTTTFMAEFADLSETETRCGYNPLLEDFVNTSILVTGGEQMYEDRRRPPDLFY
ncbi:hypothetical protein AB1Y20_005664 [Prymnesium parvum]|uniref:Protein arginine methyltransferase NDUFAF7 n=1 Tax=Prymnesium parvum TaxID=97485 RepID=A0AB34J6W4_PRYPA